jgi:shikimate kinase
MMKALSIVLIGMMGAGKSSVGRCLHRRTGRALFDTDEIVTSELGLSIPEIFVNHGEKKFRDAETEALNGLVGQQETIIVSGGGIVLRSENCDLLNSLGAIVWLDANDETLFERASRRPNRPLLQTDHPQQTFMQLLAARRPLYAKIAEVRIDTSFLGQDEVADEILNKMEQTK